MFIESKVFTLKEGYAEEFAKKFSKGEKIKQAEGFVEIIVMKRVRKGENEELIVMTRWEDQKAYTSWKNSDAHKAGHAQKKEKPDFIVNVKMDTYTVEGFNSK